MVLSKLQLHGQNHLMYIQIGHFTILHLSSSDADIHGWWVQGDTTRHDTYKATREAPGGKTFFIAHGRSLPIPVYKKWIQQLVEMGHSVFIFDYRDFGKSTGVPTESNMNADAEMALNYVAKRQNISVCCCGNENENEFV